MVICQIVRKFVVVMSINNMKFHQFTSTGEIMYADTLVKDCALIAERIEEFHHIKLYQVGKLYMEIYHHRHFNVIVKVNTFADTSFLEPYLQNISLEGLL
jgi:hypothetical protein